MSAKPENLSQDDSPFELSPEHEQRVRDRAYHLWESEGRPEGRDLEYWERARELDAIASNPGTGLMPDPATSPPGTAYPGLESGEQPVEEAELMQNLGEFPDRLTDQGDRIETPMTTKAIAARRRRTG